MANELSEQPTGRMNRRQMLGSTTALLGGAIAGVGGHAFAQEHPTATPAAAAAGGPNLKPPVVQVKGGTLRGLREGKTSSFLGIRYAEAERFGPPTPVQPWTGIKNAQAWGPVCPIPEQASVGPDELVFPHRYWIANEHCQYLNVWTQNLTPTVRKPVMVCCRQPEVVAVEPHRPAVARPRQQAAASGHGLTVRRAARRAGAPILACSHLPHRRRPIAGSCVLMSGARSEEYPR